MIQAQKKGSPTSINKNGDIKANLLTAVPLSINEIINDSDRRKVE
jgi:hypothetical protein